MKKPNNYDNTPVIGDYTPIDLGGHILVIKQVEEVQSSTGKDMLKIFLDTDISDKQPKYYEESFKNDIRPNKTWGCIVYQLTEDDEGNTNKGLKAFLTSVERSNPGYSVTWGNKFAESLKGKLVGGIFGKEEYLNKNNEKKKATKCFYFRTVDTIKNGVEIPEERLLPTNDKQNSYSTNNNGFMNIPDGIDEELPFN